MQNPVRNKKPLGERLINSNWRIIFFPLWLLYRPIIGLRNVAYDRGLFRPRRLSKPVISIGNIIAGGSGKTPLVAFMVSLLKAKHTVHILSRGYKGDGQQNEEAALIDAPVHCNSNRYVSGKQAIQAGADVLILDDGFQHRQLARDCDIVLIDATRPFGFAHTLRGAVLPLGFLRESHSALKRADMLILTRCDQAQAHVLKQLRHIAQRYGKDVYECQHQATCLRDHTGHAFPLQTLHEQSCICVSGIAHPQAFIDTARALNYQIRDRIDYPDHHHFSPADVSHIQALAEEHQAAVLCTSKDAVKLAALWPNDSATQLYSLEIEIGFSDEDQARLLSDLQQYLPQ